MIKNYKILIVEDSITQAESLKHLLEGHNYTVETASNGVEALEIACQKPPDMIITDVLMPKMDGFQLCRKIKRDETLKNVPVLFYSATFTDKESQKLALDIGAIGYILKPQESDVFIKIINKIWDKYSMGGLKPTKKPLEEKVYMKMYNELLIQKLEKKMLDLEKSEKLGKHLFSVLKAIRSINQLITKEKNVNILLQEACDILIGARGYNAAWLGFLKDEKTFAIVVGSPHKEIVFRFREQVLGGDCPPCIKKALIQKDQFLLINTYKECGDCNLKDIHGEEQSAIIRIEHNHRLLGLLAIILAPEVSINKEEEGLLKELAGDIAFGLHNIEMEKKDKLAGKKLQQSYQKLEKAMNATIETMSKIVEAKDPYTAGHQRRVSQLTLAITTELNLSQGKIEGARIASLIHDIGKIGLPTEILSKPISLTDIEFSLIKEHSQIGYDILKSIDFSYPVANIVLQHHERLDGSGYPNKLKGEDILLEAKIIGVADVVEAMSSHRPYRPALGIDKALEEISKNKGILYDPEVVDTCLKLFKKKVFKFNEGASIGI